MSKFISLYNAATYASCDPILCLCHSSGCNWVLNKSPPHHPKEGTVSIMLYRSWIIPKVEDNKLCNIVNSIIRITESIPSVRSLGYSYHNIFQHLKPTWWKEKFQTTEWSLPAQLELVSSGNKSSWVQQPVPTNGHMCIRFFCSWTFHKYFFEGGMASYPL